MRRLRAWVKEKHREGLLCPLWPKKGPETETPPWCGCHEIPKTGIFSRFCFLCRRPCLSSLCRSWLADIRYKDTMDGRLERIREALHRFVLNQLCLLGRDYKQRQTKLILERISYCDKHSLRDEVDIQHINHNRKWQHLHAYIDTWNGMWNKIMLFECNGVSYQMKSKKNLFKAKSGLQWYRQRRNWRLAEWKSAGGENLFAFGADLTAEAKLQAASFCQGGNRVRSEPKVRRPLREQSILQSFIIS